MFIPAHVIQKKRDGKELKDEEIRNFIEGLSNGEVTDYQATALLMAVYFQGMTPRETVALTQVMLQSGDRYDLSKIPGSKIDKHSTGGVGDKVSIILAPLAAACGLKVPMMSGRGLGHTGGTLDKLQSIQGFDINLSRNQFIDVLSRVGCAMTGQTQQIAPADKKLYALRDVTGTVECVPLITASILSKKLAEGAEALVIDVKTGSGAFMKNREQAKKLAKTLVQVAKKMGLPCRAVLTDMSQPLGYSVGNALEIMESIEVLKNEKNPELSSVDLKELTIHLCAQMLILGGISKNISEGRKLALNRLTDGSAWRAFQNLVRAQGGNIEEISNSKNFQKAEATTVWKAKKKGYLSKMNTEEIGRILVELGGGRKKVSDSINPSVGLLFHKKLGHRIQTGEPIVTVHYSSQSEKDLPALENQFQSAIEISGARKSVPKLIFEQYS